MQEVMLEYYNWQTLNDMTPTILKMKQLNPDVVHHIGFGNDAVLFWRQSREQNFLFKALVHAGATGYGGGGFRQGPRPHAQGVVAPLQARAGLPPPAPRPPRPQDAKAPPHPGPKT